MLKAIRVNESDWSSVEIVDQVGSILQHTLSQRLTETFTAVTAACCAVRAGVFSRGSLASYQAHEGLLCTSLFFMLLPAECPDRFEVHLQSRP